MARTAQPPAQGRGVTPMPVMSTDRGEGDSLSRGLKSPGGPDALGSAGRALWRAVEGAHALDATQEVLLVEACRSKDRLDLMHVRGDLGQVGGVRLVVDGTSTRQKQTALLLSQLLAALRLPNAHGRRPQRRSARGVYAPRAGAS